MSFDSRDFRQALGCFATGITVVTALGADGKGIGVTINAFTSVSLEPPLVAFCLGRNAGVFDDISAAEAFVINILGEKQEGCSQHFASRQTQRQWDAVPHVTAANGAPALTGTAATLECTMENVLEGGDHIIVLGRVTALAAHIDVKPLLYWHGRYATVA